MSTSSPFVRIRYTNHRGITNDKIIEPMVLYFGTSPWHQKEQWLLDAVDQKKLVQRTYAMADVQSWDALSKEDVEVAMNRGNT